LYSSHLLNKINSKNDAGIANENNSSFGLHNGVPGFSNGLNIRIHFSYLTCLAYRKVDISQSFSSIPRKSCLGFSIKAWFICYNEKDKV
jgi:hypothetical protein